MNEPRDRDSLAYVVGVLRRRWLVIAVSVAACVCVAVVVKVTQSDTYDGTARVLFGTSSLSDAALDVQRGGGDPEREAATNVLLARSQAVAERVRAQVNAPESVRVLIRKVTAEAEENANVIRITVSDPNPQRAAQLANAFAQQFIAFRAQGDVQSIAATETDLRNQLNSLPRDSADRQVISQSLQRLATLRALANGDARVISSAETPNAPSNPSSKQLLVLAIVLGLAVGLAAAFLLESIDRRISSIEDFEEGYRLRALTVVPQKAFRAQGMQARSADLEPFRILRTALDFARVTRPFRALLITSAVQAEGKTTVAVDLAHAIALGGKPVILVQLDLRRPSFAHHIELPLRAGVTTALLGRASVGDLVQRPLPDLPHFGLLAGGPPPPNPAELLESPALDAMLRELLEDPDVTLVLDAPPLLPVADAQVLLSQPAVDASLIVAREGQTTRDQVRRARSILDGHVVVPLGLVVTGHAARDAYGYGYGQGEFDETPSQALDVAPLPPAPGAPHSQQR
jgi:receptor protein-tyrosine kinase